MFVDIFNTDKRYRLILADPAWKYDDSLQFKKFRKKTHRLTPSGAKFHYDLMSTEEICNLPIPKIKAKDSVCFLWVTTVFLPEGFEVLKSWEFKYKTALVWDKNRIGMGNWFRVNTEFCLLGISGKIKAFKLQLSNIIKETPKKHSKKPKRFFHIFDNLDLWPKIELFSRNNLEKWDCWGNEVPQTQQQRIGKFLDKKEVN